MDLHFNVGSGTVLAILVVVVLIARFSRSKRRNNGSDPVNWWLHSDAGRDTDKRPDPRDNDGPGDAADNGASDGDGGDGGGD